jgi:ElaB/YqjD/DUF883 family membrane-anchored ribosome-binding protein
VSIILAFLYQNEVKEIHAETAAITEEINRLKSTIGTLSQEDAREAWTAVRARVQAVHDRLESLPERYPEGSTTVTLGDL